MFRTRGYKQSTRENSAILLTLMHVKHTTPYRNCINNRLPEDEPSGSKYVEDIKIKN